MQLIPVTSASNPFLKKIRGLHRRAMREKAGMFIIEGAKQVIEAIKKNVEIEEIFVSQSFLKAGLGEVGAQDLKTIYVADDKQFCLLSSTEHSCGIIALAQMPVWKQDRVFQKNDSLIVIADQIQDPGNLGTLLRTAQAAGATAVILTKGTVDPFNPKVVRAATGALFTLPILVDQDLCSTLELVAGKSMQLVACTPDADQPYWEIDFTKPTALVFGNEGQGLSGNTKAMVNKTVCIPMDDQSESLNVSVSAAVILFAAHKQRLLNATNK